MILNNIVDIAIALAFLTGSGGTARTRQPFRGIQWSGNHHSYRIDRMYQ
jgi:hypothetical protein